MTFTEKTHAFIAAEFYARMKERFGERGVMAFIQASVYYGEQRGRRMAQRCIRDGQPLTAANYYRYGEWEPTKEMVEAEESNQSSFKAYEPDAVMKITRCPWARQFRQMKLNRDGGVIYCRVIDASIVRGFNPDLKFITQQTLQTSTYCLQTMKNAGFTAKTSLAKKPENIRTFAFHCAHLYHAYRKECEAVFGEEGRVLAEGVLQLYAENYGQEDAEIICRYQNTDFDRCDAAEQ